MGDRQHTFSSIPSGNSRSNIPPPVPLQQFIPPPMPQQQPLPPPLNQLQPTPPPSTQQQPLPPPAPLQQLILPPMPQQQPLPPPLNQLQPTPPPSTQQQPLPPPVSLQQLIPPPMPEQQPLPPPLNQLQPAPLPTMQQQPTLQSMLQQPLQQPMLQQPLHLHSQIQQIQGANPQLDLNNHGVPVVLVEDIFSQMQNLIEANNQNLLHAIYENVGNRRQRLNDGTAIHNNLAEFQNWLYPQSTSGTRKRKNHSNPEILEILADQNIIPNDSNISNNRSNNGNQNFQASPQPVHPSVGYKGARVPQSVITMNSHQFQQSLLVTKYPVLSGKIWKSEKLLQPRKWKNPSVVEKKSKPITIKNNQLKVEDTQLNLTREHWEMAHAAIGQQIIMENMTQETGYEQQICFTAAYDHYRLRIVELSASLGWPLTSDLDVEFRHLQWTNSTAWDIMDPLLLNKYYLRKITAVTEALSTTPRAFQHHREKEPNQIVPCNYFNSTRGCINQNCSYPHICSKCQGSHAKTQCPLKHQAITKDLKLNKSNHP